MYVSNVMRLKFIFNKIPDDFSLILSVLVAHFSTAYFVNLSQCNVGFAERLLLNCYVAVQTIANPYPMCEQSNVGVCT